MIRHFKTIKELTEQEMSLAAAQAVVFAWTPTPVAVFVTGVAFPVAVRVLVGGALRGRRRAAAVIVQLPIVSAGGAGVHVGPGAGQTRLIAIWKPDVKTTE